MITVVEIGGQGNECAYFVCRDDEPRPYDSFVNNYRFHRLTWAQMRDVEAGYEEALQGYKLGGE